MQPRRLFLRRSAAYLVDILLLFAVLFPLGWAVVLSLGFSPTSGVQIWQATLLNFSIPAWLYFTLSDSLWGGQTLGKRLFHLKVTVPPGLPLTLPRALLRTALKLLPWELAHIGGFALADAVQERAQRKFGIIAALAGERLRLDLRVIHGDALTSDLDRTAGADGLLSKL